ncbi:MAG: DUF1491 family protein [Pararhodobacter sp.]|nr:DUF1491 family protein [Pararhodobacter sp.]
MSAPRLTAEFWVRAYLARLRLAGVPAYVVARGDATAGAVMVKLATLDGRAQLWQRQFDPLEDRRQWTCATRDAEPEIDALIARERRRDPDLWVIELEDRSGRHLLNEPGLDG